MGQGYPWSNGLGIYPWWNGLGIYPWSNGLGIYPWSNGLGIYPWSNGLGIYPWSNGLGIYPWSNGLGIYPWSNGLGIYPWSNGLGIYPWSNGLGISLLISHHIPIMHRFYYNRSVFIDTIIRNYNNNCTSSHHHCFTWKVLKLGIWQWIQFSQIFPCSLHREDSHHLLHCNLCKHH